MKTPPGLLFLVLISIPAPPLKAADVALRIRFGLGDFEPRAWDGSLEVTGGTLVSVEGWRFERDDAMTGAASWEASTRELTARKKRSNNTLRAGAKGREIRVPMADNGVLVRLSDVLPETAIAVTTAEGKFSFTTGEVTLKRPLRLMEGRVEIDRVADGEALMKERTDDDQPALAVDADGAWHVAWVSFRPGLDRDERSKSWTEAPADFDFLATPVGGDQVWLRSRALNGSWGEAVAVTGPGADVFKCATAVAGDGKVWVLWSERRDGAFGVWGRAFSGGKAAGAAVPVSTGKGNQHGPVAVVDGAGRVWVAWQGAAGEGGAFRIFARHQERDGWSEVIDVSGEAAGNAWAPEIAAGRGEDGRVAIAWDTYAEGDYDVMLREFGADGRAEEVRPVANTADYEARPSLAYDGGNRLWLAWEEGGASWGKDFGAYEQEDGIGLYRGRQIALRVLDGGEWKAPAGDLAAALRGVGMSEASSRTAPANAEFTGGENSRKKGEEAGETAEDKGKTLLNNLARIVADGSGRIWVISRSRQGSFHTPVGGVWINYASFLDGEIWAGPILIPHSDNLLYNRPAVAGLKNGLALAHSTDHRQDRGTEWVKARSAKDHDGTAGEKRVMDPFDNDIYVSRLPGGGEAKAPVLAAAEGPAAGKKPSAATLAEREAVQRCREYRAEVGGTELRILRGEFHRHTEISSDGMNDGALEDMWRYAMDVAAMDWVGNGDHDNGGGREYPWWMTQKTTDAYHLPGSFDPLFTYERSVSYPEGHRNVVFVKRGIRTLPRLPISDRRVEEPAPDTNMLYAYLHHFDGICASHTSATSMGTDWRNHDPVVEPFVEIYQGARQNYERPGAPRCPTEDDAIGGWEPKGFVNLAFKKGYRMAFQASSDHGSTHISYCLVYAEEASRQAIFDAMKARHTYGATDNIVADLRCRSGGAEHMMGDEFTVAEPPTLELKLIGTAPFAKVTLIKDDEEVQIWEPGTAEVDLSWTDEKAAKGGTSYYYFRGEQENTELVWVSPMWITYEPKK